MQNITRVEYGYLVTTLDDPPTNISPEQMEKMAAQFANAIDDGIRWNLGMRPDAIEGECTVVEDKEVKLIERIGNTPV